MTIKESTLCFTTGGIACLAVALLRDEPRALASAHRAMVLYHSARPCAPLQHDENEALEQLSQLLPLQSILKCLHQALPSPGPCLPEQRLPIHTEAKA